MKVKHSQPARLNPSCVPPDRGAFWRTNRRASALRPMAKGERSGLAGEPLKLFYRQFLHLLWGQQCGGLDQAAEFLLRCFEMGSVTSGEFRQRFVANLQAFDLNDTQVLVSAFPDLSLVQFHEAAYGLRRHDST